MIEGNNTNELQGQLDLTDVMNRGTGEPTTPEGYDAEGHLLDYAPGEETTSSAPDGAPPHLVRGERARFRSCEGEASETLKAFPYGEGGPRSGSDEVPATAATPDRLTALAVEINAITEQTRGVVISFALAVGKRLIEAKSLCPEGRWTEWLAKSVNYSERKAQDMMRLYAEYGRDGQIPDSIAALDYSKAVALLSAPAEAREELALKAEAEDLSVRQLQAEIKALKEKAEGQQVRIDALVDSEKTAWDKVQEQKRQMDGWNDARVELESKEAELQQTRAAVATAAEKIAAANAKADAAESAAAELRKLHSDAEDRAAANAQRASDAVNRANQTAKDLAEARAEIARLEEEARRGADAAPAPEPVEVIPEAVTRELEDLRAQLAEAKANQGTTSPGAGAPPSPKGEGYEASAVEKFKWFYANQMKPAFTTALNLLREVAKEDGGAADAYATALTKACQMLMNQLGTRD